MGNIYSVMNKCLTWKAHCKYIFFIDYFKFNRDVLCRTTQQSDDLRLPFVKLESTKKAFF